MVETKDLTTLQRALAARLIDLAEDSLKKGNVDEAERLYREVVHFLELVLDPEHMEIGKALYKLAFILEFQDKNVESIEMIRRARAIMRNAKQAAVNVDNIFAPFVWERTS